MHRDGSTCINFDLKYIHINSETERFISIENLRISVDNLVNISNFFLLIIMTKQVTLQVKDYSRNC